MNVSDHYTRSVAQLNQLKIFGALFGVQQGRDIHICDAFEIGSESDGKETEHMLRMDAFESDMANCELSSSLFCSVFCFAL